ncbi:MAG: toxin-antitoxin system YwqK family antitoxin [Candidatus Omnitrophica bacterium]|nr:toxin-antitoxin system YwqK family antitoxin [Candidatus Omnitrophota bacterium]MCB9719281.1 toxin-antitoxin system YwqK family antitoxin [Candidatus Omnitrophota bacterium]
MNVKRLVLRIAIVIVITGSYAFYLQWQMRPRMREVVRLYDKDRKLLVRRFMRYGNHGEFSLHYAPTGELVTGDCADFLIRADIALQGTCEEGKFEGPIRGYDHLNRIALEGTYRDGLKHGEFRSYRDGRLNRIQNFDMGQLSGRQEDYYANGNINCTATYEHHHRSGVYNCYYPDGTPRLEDYFSNGRRNGLHRRWDPDGSLVWEMPFENGREVLHSEIYRVRSVISGDTILLDNDRRVRLLGIREIPGTTADNKSKPREVLKEVLRQGSRFADVRLEFLEPPVGEGDWEAYVFVDTGYTLDQLKKLENFEAPDDGHYDFYPVRLSQFINATLLKKGVVRIADMSADDRYYSLFRSLERK